MKRTPEPLLPGDDSRKRGGNKGSRVTSTLPPSFESWGFTQRTLDRFEIVLIALRFDLERQRQILGAELLLLEEREQELKSRVQELEASAA